VDTDTLITLLTHWLLPAWVTNVQKIILRKVHIEGGGFFTEENFDVTMAKSLVLFVGNKQPHIKIFYD